MKNVAKNKRESFQSSEVDGYCKLATSTTNVSRRPEEDHDRLKAKTGDNENELKVIRLVM